MFISARRNIISLILSIRPFTSPFTVHPSTDTYTPTTHHLALLFYHPYTYQNTSLISSSNYPSPNRFTYEFIVHFAHSSIHALFINPSPPTFIHPVIHSSTYSRVFSSFTKLRSPSIYDSCFFVPLVCKSILKLLQPVAFRIKKLRERIN